MSNNIQLTAEQAEEEFGPLWEVLGFRNMRIDEGAILGDCGYVTGWVLFYCDRFVLSVTPSVVISLQEATILKALLLGGRVT